jgi:hypothetical protein
MESKYGGNTPVTVTVRFTVLLELRQLLEIFLAKLLISIRQTQMSIINTQSQLHVSARIKPYSGCTQICSKFCEVYFSLYIHRVSFYNSITCTNKCTKTVFLLFSFITYNILIIKKTVKKPS